MTYLQRYTLLSATGLATMETDDDGRAAVVAKPVGTVSDPFSRSEQPSQDVEVWQDLAPDLWRVEESANGSPFGELADLPDGDKLLAKLWATDRSNPALCAWAAGWIARTMAKLGITWPSGLPEAEAGQLPEDFQELNTSGLWAVAASVRKLQIAAAKGGAA